MQRFQATIEPVPGGGHFVAVPKSTAEAAGLRYGVRVRGAVAGAPYRSSLMMYSGAFHMGVHKATLAAAGVAAGDTVDVTIEVDDQPLPTDTVPPELAKALAGNAAAKAAFAAQSPSHKREHVKYILDAKQATTRERRIAKTVATLAATSAKPAGAIKRTTAPAPTKRAGAAKRTKAATTKRAGAAKRAKAATKRAGAADRTKAMTTKRAGAAKRTKAATTKRTGAAKRRG